MLRRSTMVALIPITLSLAIPATFSGQDHARRVVSLTETAALLARSGVEHGDARAVLAAAQIMIIVERPSPGLVSDRAPLATPARTAGRCETLSAAGLLRCASSIATDQRDAPSAQIAAALARDSVIGIGDPQLAEALQRTADALATTRGAEGGPMWYEGSLAPGASEEFTIRFQGGRVPNEITASASNYDGDVDCYLYDGDRETSRDEDFQRHCRLAWTQVRGGELRLRIRNKGAATSYTLRSN